MLKDNTGILIVLLIVSILIIMSSLIIIEKNNQYKFISEMASKGYHQVLINKEIVWQKCKLEANVQ
jgi:hypothetical protein